LTIGSGQALGVVGTGSNVQTVSFTGATLAGGTATLMPGLIGNSAYTSPENITIGAIGQSTSGSGLTISGTGTVTLTGNNTYTGATAVTGGTLAVTNALAGSGVTVSDATLSGTGTISATSGVTLGNGLGDAGTAILRAGTATAVGTLTVHGLALNNDAGFNFQVNLASDSFSEVIWPWAMESFQPPSPTRPVVQA
jgi:autotransporter-associated beta strand protein